MSCSKIFREFRDSLCKVLGINPSGTLGNLLTSRLVLGALGYELGY